MSSATNYGLPLKLLEYTSLGLPSLTIRNAAIGYYFGQDDCLFYDPADADSLRRVLESLADNPEILLRYRQRAIALREKFRWSVEKQKYISILHELCSEPVVAPVNATLILRVRERFGWQLLVSEGGELITSGQQPPCLVVTCA